MHGNFRQETFKIIYSLFKQEAMGFSKHRNTQVRVTNSYQKSLTATNHTQFVFSSHNNPPIEELVRIQMYGFYRSGPNTMTSKAVERGFFESQQSRERCSPFARPKQATSRPMAHYEKMQLQMQRLQCLGRTRQTRTLS